jgi:hypothetical protein
LVVAISPNTAPITQTVGTHANAWDNAATGANGNSATVDCQYTPHISIFGTSSGNTSILVQVSQNNTNFYTLSSFTAGSGDFGVSLTVGARYVRLQSGTNRTVTATIAGKSGGRTLNNQYLHLQILDRLRSILTIPLRLLGPPLLTG